MYHLHIHRVSRGIANAATDKLAYIQRTGRYAARDDRVRLTRSINMPCWADDASGKQYWRAADSERGRSNGRLLFNIEAAIPRKLPVGLQNDLVHGFARLISRISTGLPDKSALPATYAIHEGDGVSKPDSAVERNPHVHFNASVSINDGVEREPQKWFRRFNPTHIAEGGARKSAYIGTKRWLMQVRRCWARLANSALKKAGLAGNLDHRSHRARGIITTPTVHVGPKGTFFSKKGLPTWRTNLNLKLHKSNVQFTDAQRRVSELQDMKVSEEADWQRLEAELEADLAKSMVELRHELSAHPLQGTPDQIIATATAVVFTMDLAHPTVAMRDTLSRHLWTPSETYLAKTGWQQGLKNSFGC